MMSKELKLGFGVGGALLAVLIVYVLVIPASKPDQSVELVKTGDTTSTGTDGGAADTTRNTPPVEIVGTANPKKDTARTDAENGDQVFGNPGDKPTPRNVNTSSAGDVWDCLQTGQVVKLMGSEKVPVNGGAARTTPPLAPAPTPTEPVTSGAPAPRSAVSDNASRITPATAPSVASNVLTSGSLPAPAVTSGSPASSNIAMPAAVTGKTTTHVVQAGETLGDIAETAYGSRAFWPHILRANPGIVPEKIRTGTTLVLPDPADVHPTRTASAGPTTGPSSSALVANGRLSAEAPIDPKTQYRIASGDSLYRISVKLYGKGDQVEKIYELNKDAIGADPAKLKLGMIIKLPQPPSVATVQ